MKRFILIAAAILFVLYAVPLVLIFIFQRSFMYFPPPQYLSPPDVGIDAQEIDFGGADAARSTAWWIAPKSGHPVIMFFHGNGSAVYSNHDIYADLSAAGYGVFAAGYAGYPARGGKDGKPSQTVIVDGVEAQYDWLAGQGFAPDDIIFYGTSLGTGIAAQLSARRKPAMMIMEAPFNSTLDLGRQTMPIFPIGLLMKDTFRSDVALENLDVPLLWMHGTKDDVIALSQGQKLFDAYNGPKADLVITGGQHTNLWSLGGREFVLDALQRR